MPVVRRRETIRVVEYRSECVVKYLGVLRWSLSTL